jgi:hypothetical protein
MGPRLAAEMERYLAKLPPVLREPGRWLFTSSQRPRQRLPEAKPQIAERF